MRFLLVTIAGCVLVLWAVATPGFSLGGLLCPFISFCLFAGAGLIWAIAAGVIRFATNPTRRNTNCFAAALLLAAVTFILALSPVPMYIGLAISVAGFEALIPTAPVGMRGEPPGWVGCYYVDHYAADGHGGVYFRTASHPDGIGPDTVSYGFAYRPSREKCPFGRTRYHVAPLFGDWYQFEVSDD